MMSVTPGHLHSELPAIDLFRKMGYGYYDGSLADERETIGEAMDQVSIHQLIHAFITEEAEPTSKVFFRLLNEPSFPVLLSRN
ncbi:MAG: hypothetical protein JXA23_10465 [Bacteroidales bacterium]|nr:hypothetical protein [Bacteroidales bacterium]